MTMDQTPILYRDYNESPGPQMMDDLAGKIWYKQDHKVWQVLE